MRVFVTGTGAISSLGNSPDEMFRALKENQTGVRAYPEWRSLNGLRSFVGAPAKDYDISSLPRQARRTMSRMSEMSLLATLQAMKQANLNLSEMPDQDRILLCLGSTTGSPDTLQTFFKKYFDKGGPEGQVSTSFFKTMNHSVASNVGVALGFHGPLISPSSACTTGAQAMILGWELLQSGLYDMAIVGGADELHSNSAAVFDIVHAASTHFNEKPSETPRPFDRRRDGLVVSEGSGMLVLETENSIRRRQVKPLAEFKGGAYFCDGVSMAHTHAPTMERVMRAALSRANITEADIQYVNAHATATEVGDREEAFATGKVFGSQVPVSSLKGHFGHSLSACGALEAISCIKMMNEGVVINTRNLEEIDPECQHVQHLQSLRQLHTKNIMSNNFAFGGMNTSLILSAL